MSAVLEISDSDLRVLEEACAAEITERVLRGEWEDFTDDPALHADLAAILVAALKVADSDCAMGDIRLALEPMARAYADGYMVGKDAQEVAHTLGLEV